MRRTTLVVVGLAVVLFSGAEAASAFVSGNTIDERATYQQARQAGVGERSDRLLARRAHLDQGHGHPAGDSSPRP